jgi:hypothetical protein
VLQNTIASVWPASEWTPELLVEKIKEPLILHGVYKHSSKIFGPYWDPTRPMANEVKRRNANLEVGILQLLHGYASPFLVTIQI